MASIQLKVVDEGIHANLSAFLQRLRVALLVRDVYISENAPITLKVKFCHDDGHQKVLIQVRESGSKMKINEQVLRYYPWDWIAKCADMAAEQVEEAMTVA